MNSQVNSLAQGLEEMENHRDALDARLATFETANEENLPFTLVERLSGGENPIKVWREHRGLSVAELAHASNLDEASVNQFETDEREPGLRVMAMLARALRTDLELLVPPSQD